MTTRTPFADLPTDTQDAVRQQLGDDYTVEDATGGSASHTAAILTTSAGSKVFAKGVRDGSPGVEDLDTEEEVNPHVPNCTPRVLWRVHAGGWHLLASEAVDGAFAAYEPGSPDLQLAAGILDRLSRTTAPDIRLYDAWHWWGYWTRPEDAPLLYGDTLIHLDPAATNILVGDRRAWIVDWSWASRGPAWVDTALWATRLISDGGHTPEQAWEQAQAVEAFRDAPRRAVAVVARADALSWEDRHAGGIPGIERVVKAARDWADYLA
jgi:hypothetical protein